MEENVKKDIFEIKSCYSHTLRNVNIDIPFNKSELVDNCTKEELADMLIGLYDFEGRKNKIIHNLLENCERFENEIIRLKREHGNL